MDVFFLLQSRADNNDSCNPKGRIYIAVIINIYSGNYKIIVPILLILIKYFNSIKITFH